MRIRPITVSVVRRAAHSRSKATTQHAFNEQNDNKKWHLIESAFFFRLEFVSSCALNEFTLRRLLFMKQMPTLKIQNEIRGSIISLENRIFRVFSFCAREIFGLCILKSARTPHVHRILSCIFFAMIETATAGGATLILFSIRIHIHGSLHSPKH